MPDVAGKNPKKCIVIILKDAIGNVVCTLFWNRFCNSNIVLFIHRTPQSSYDNVQPHSFDSNPYGYNPLTTMDQYGSGHANVLEHQFGSHTGFGSSSGHHSQEPSGEDACAVTEWGPWSSCQDPCGKGVRFQSRKFKNPQQAAAQGCETRVEIKNKARCPVAPECSDLTDATDTTVFLLILFFDFVIGL